MALFLLQCFQEARYDGKPTQSNLWIRTCSLNIFYCLHNLSIFQKKCIHDGIDTLIKWSGFTALCISMSILLFNLLFNHKVNNNQIQIDHVYKWQLSIALMLNFLSFHRNTRPLWTSILISTFLYKAYLFPIKVGDLVLFTCFSISLFNSLFTSLIDTKEI